MYSGFEIPTLTLLYIRSLYVLCMDYLVAMERSRMEGEGGTREAGRAISVPNQFHA